MSNTLHVTTMSSEADSLWHAIRRADTRWTRFGNVEKNAGEIGRAHAFGAAAIGGEVHVVVQSDLYQLTHAARHADGRWSKFAPLDTAHRAVGGVALAAVNTTLHLLTRDFSGGLLHATRAPGGGWSALGDVFAQAGGGFFPYAWSMTALAGELHVFVVVSPPPSGGPATFPPGSIVHAVRRANGAWTRWENVAPRLPFLPILRGLCVTTIGQTVHLVLLDHRGNLWHTTRGFDGSWSAMEDVEGQAGDRGWINSFGIGECNGELHVVTLTAAANNLWHAVRHGTDSWQRFEDLARATGAYAVPYYGVSCVGLDAAAAQPPINPPTICYPGVAGAAGVTLANQTGDDTLVVWQIDYGGTGQPVRRAVLAPGQAVTVDLTNCGISRLIAVSQAWVADFNARFGQNYDPLAYETAETTNFQRWVGAVLGRTGAPTIAAPIA